MRDKLIVVVFFILLISCADEDLPVGLYDYQVERLLSGGSSKEWMQVVDSDNCQDSIRLLVESVNDSVDIYTLNSGISCEFQDTTYLGRANASSLGEGILFTDSLNFSDGEYWLILNLTSEFLDVALDDEILSYSGVN